MGVATEALGMRKEDNYPIGYHQRLKEIEEEKVREKERWETKR